MTEEQSGLAAFNYALEQAWEIGRGLKDAYQVDTGSDLEWTIPAWRELNPTQKLAWSVHVGPLLGQFALLATRIAENKP